MGQDGGGRRLKAALKSGVKSLLGASSQPDTLWALRHVSLEIGRGESVGLIGANGCGKSTLLRVIAGITPPTEGQVSVGGRVAGLIELTAGFHDELTGEENVLLNGAAYGFSRKEIARLMPQIAEFTELGRFMHEPVRLYSAGMLMRLGFALAVHVQPDVLLIDEAMAVGDARFQKKCMDKIRAMQAAGVTILFVSHTPELVEEVCERAVWLEAGEVRLDGASADVVREYSRTVFEKFRNSPLHEYDHLVSGLLPPLRYGDADAQIRIENARVHDIDGTERLGFAQGETFCAEMTIDNRGEYTVSVVPTWSIVAFPVCESVSMGVSEEQGIIVEVPPGKHTTTVQFLNVALRPGTYVLNIALTRPGQHNAKGAIIDTCLNFAKIRIETAGDDAATPLGLVVTEVQWELK